MRAVALVVAAVMVCGCSSSGSADLDLGTAAPTTTATTAVEPTTPPPPRSTPVVTDPPTTAAATIVTDPPTTLPPETTSPLSKEDQVRADYEAARLARAHCTIDPFSCDYASIAIPGSPMDVRTHEVVAQRTRENVRGKDGAGEVLVRVESVGFEGESAFVTVCTYDTAILFDIQDPSDPGDDIIVNDNKDSYRVRWELRLLNGKWLLFTNEGLDELHGGDLCGF